MRGDVLMTKLVPLEHRPWHRKIVPGVLVIACLTIAVVGAAGMLRTDDQDVKVYSVTPEGKVQVIGLRHRTYLFDYGGDRDLVLFATTFSTGVATYGRKEDLYPDAPKEETRESNRTR
jgi:hypothetical protein